MKFKKKKMDEGKKQEDGIRERVEELQKEEAKARRAERPKYLPDKRNVIVIITGVLCFLIVAGGIYMVIYGRTSAPPVPRGSPAPRQAQYRFSPPQTRHQASSP